MKNVKIAFLGTFFATFFCFTAFSQADSTSCEKEVAVLSAQVETLEKRAKAVISGIKQAGENQKQLINLNISLQNENSYLKGMVDGQKKAIGELKDALRMAKEKEAFLIASKKGLRESLAEAKKAVILAKEQDKLVVTLLVHALVAPEEELRANVQEILDILTSKKE